MSEIKNNPIKEVNFKVDSSQIRKDLNEEITEKVQLQEKIKLLEVEAQENEKYKEFYDQNTGHGTIPLTSDMRAKESNGHNNQKEFDSIEEMIEYCRVNDKESYKKIKDKTFGALQGNNFSWEDQFIKGEDGVERSLIGRTIQRINADHRRKIRG